MKEEDKECCKDWKPSLAKIDGFIMLQAIRQSQPNIYTGKPFVYCPWCGAKR